MNILLLSVGTRNKIVQYFKQELSNEGKVIATDCSELAPALYEADQYYIVPKIDDKNYLKIILDICQKENIKGILSLIDPELSLLSKNKQRFLNIGVVPIVSNYEVVEQCFNKYAMYSYLKENGFKTPKSYIDKEKFYMDLEKGKIKFPVFVKPISGSASININKVMSKDEIEILFSHNGNLMIQEFMNGEEYGADVYIDLISKEIISVFIKQKIKMRAGETDKSVSIKDSKLFELIKLFVKTAGYMGVVDIDIFKIDGEYYISEVNPRFGGGFPHAYECGVNIPLMIINNLKEEKNQPTIENYNAGIFMMKYSEISINRGIVKHEK